MRPACGERKKAEQSVDQQTDLGGVIWRGEFGPFNRTPFLPNITLELCRISGALSLLP
jgi:hypothetical protein